jgi:uncharacterized protein
MSTRPIALVTGASGGIGEAFARILAGRGYDLVLVARSGDRLKNLADELAVAHGAGVEVLPADLQARDRLEAVEERVTSGHRPIDMVINNAGFGSRGPLAELPVDGETGQVELNVVALVRLTHAAVSVMVPRGSGAILNVSSVAGFQPAPGNATYSATKAFVTSFTEAVHEEVTRSGVRVTCLCPGFTHTGFQAREGIDPTRVPSFLWMSADEVARAGLDALERNTAICIPGRLNRIAAHLSRHSPRAIVRKVAGRVTDRL